MQYLNVSEVFYYAIPGEFHCQNDRCVQGSTTCDGVDDCGDKSDELLESCAEVVR